MGIHRTFLTIVAKLPVKYMGLGIPDPYIECGIERAKTFVCHMGSETLTSNFISYYLQLLQIEIGLTKIFWNLISTLGAICKHLPGLHPYGNLCHAIRSHLNLQYNYFQTK